MEEQVTEIVDTYLRPLVEADGGTIELVSVTESEVVVKLGGKCAGCPGRPYTLNNVVRAALSKQLGRAVSVVAAS